MSTPVKALALWLTALAMVAAPALPGAALSTTTTTRTIMTATTTVDPAAVDVAATSSVRLAGSNRYATAVAVSQHLYPGGASTVVVASGLKFPDGLASGPAADRLGAPVLLVKDTSVPDSVRAELARLAPERIYVAGGTAAVSAQVEQVLDSYAPVTRLAGADRDATAAAIAGLWDRAPTVYLASGLAFPDALSGGAAAAHVGAPVLLVSGTSISPETRARLQALQPGRVVVLGGSSAVPDSVVDSVVRAVPAVVERWSGANRYETAKVVAQKVWPAGAGVAFYATGDGFADALAGVPAAGAAGSPLLLVRQACAPRATQDATAYLVVESEFVLGGPAVVADGAPTTPCPPPSGSVLAALEDIAVKGRAPKTGYDRSEFGPAWTDNVDVQGGHNGCDTRNDVLRRDLDDLVVTSGTMGCKAQTGWLNDPFTGDLMWFEFGVTSSGIHIDHLVALSDAWQKGAQQLTLTERTNFANDPLNLWAVDGGQNSSKGDSDAATWLPPNRPVWCDYVSYQVAVKKKYELWMTDAEKTAITDIINTRCPTKRLPTSNDVPPPIR